MKNPLSFLFVFGLTVLPGLPAASAQTPFLGTVSVNANSSDAIAVDANSDAPGSVIAMLRDFSNSKVKFDYGYELWKDLSGHQQHTPLGLRVFGGAKGGIGAILHRPVDPSHATYLRVNVIVRPGNTVDVLQLKLIGDTNVVLILRTSAVTEGKQETFLLTIPRTRPKSINQVQLQGDFSPSGKVDFERLDIALLENEPL